MDFTRSDVWTYLFYQASFTNHPGVGDLHLDPCVLSLYNQYNASSSLAVDSGGLELGELECFHDHVEPGHLTPGRKKSYPLSFTIFRSPSAAHLTP